MTKYAWCVSNASSRLHKVGTLRPNDLGLFDMHGNAWEWCHNWVDRRPASVPPPIKDVITNTVQRPARGGAFGHGPLTVQSANEIPIPPTDRGGDLGFRLARTIR